MAHNELENMDKELPNHVISIPFNLFAKDSCSFKDLSVLTMVH